MFKNVSGQTVAVQMISAADGSAFTGSVSVFVTGDGGTQAAGGATAPAHEGNGCHTYRPTQAETNYDHVAYTFTGSGAVPATVQTWTRAGDAYTRLGAPAGASVSADIAAVKAQTAAIETDTQDIQSRIPAALLSGRIDASVGAMAADTITSSALASSAVTEIQTGLATSAALATIKVTTDKLDGTLTLTSDGYVYTTAALQNGPSGGGGGSGPTAAEIADAVWDEEVDGSVTARQSLRLSNSAMGGIALGMETTEAKFRDLANTKDRITATVDPDGNRSAIVRDLT